MMMKMKLNQLFMIGLCVALSLNLNSRDIEGKSSTPPGKPGKGSLKAADCVPPTGYREFDLNNVKFGVETAGLLWFNRQAGNPGYEVPKGSGINSIFAGGLWMGGTSPDQQLKLAAVHLDKEGQISGQVH